MCKNTRPNNDWWHTAIDASSVNADAWSGVLPSVIPPTTVCSGCVQRRVIVAIGKHELIFEKLECNVNMKLNGALCLYWESCAETPLSYHCCESHVHPRQARMFAYRGRNLALDHSPSSRFKWDLSQRWNY